MLGAYWEQDGLALYRGDCRDVMAQMEPESVSCCVTSPPFWGLRSYACPPSVWGGEHGCEHEWEDRSKTLTENPSMLGPNGTIATDRHRHDRRSIVKTGTCSLCGAVKCQYGQEPTVAMYVDHSIEVLRAIKRVLRKDGVVWWDLDDSRGGSWGNYAPTGKGGQRSKTTDRWDRPAYADTTFRPPTSRVAEKSLCLIPQRVAIAAQDDGWIVRSQIIIPRWMPESAKDRPTDAYRVVLMLVKNKRYWYDAQAVRVKSCTYGDTGDRQPNYAPRKYLPEEDAYDHNRAGGDGLGYSAAGLRNLGNIWNDLTQTGYPDAHFATFPIDEPLRCIKASCPSEICIRCGRARERVVGDTKYHPPIVDVGVRQVDESRGDKTRRLSGADYYRSGGRDSIGWTDCGCGVPFEPGLVLDPFVGTGTTLIAARKLGRRGIGIDASEDYLKQAVRRLTVGDKGVRQIVAARRNGAHQEPLL